MKGPKQRILVVVCKKIRLNVRDGGVRAPLSAVRESGWRPGGRSTNVRKRVSGPLWAVPRLLRLRFRCFGQALE